MKVCEQTVALHWGLTLLLFHLHLYDLTSCS